MTEAAIQVAARELQRRGMIISPDGSRSLTLSVNEVEFGGTSSTVHTNVSMHVESGGVDPAKFLLEKTGLCLWVHSIAKSMERSCVRPSQCLVIRR
jgi:hypothetical protein